MARRPRPGGERRGRLTAAAVRPAGRGSPRSDEPRRRYPRRCRCAAGPGRSGSARSAPPRRGRPARLARIRRLLRSARALSATRKASGRSVSEFEQLGYRRLAPVDQRLQPGERAGQDQLPLEVEEPEDARVARRGQDVGDHASRVLCLRSSKTCSARPMPPRSARSRAYSSVRRLAKASSPAPPPKPSGHGVEAGVLEHLAEEGRLEGLRGLAGRGFGGRPWRGRPRRRGQRGRSGEAPSPVSPRAGWIRSSYCSQPVKKS